MNANVAVDQIPLDCLDILAAHLTVGHIVGLGVGHLEAVVVLDRDLVGLFGAREARRRTVDLDLDSLGLVARVDYVEEFVEHSTQTQLETNSSMNFND